MSLKLAMMATNPNKSTTTAMMPMKSTTGVCNGPTKMEKEREVGEAEKTIHRSF